MAIERSKRPIGIFDSGIGGLSVANAVFTLLPHENFIYVGDTARIPYGNKSQAEILEYSFEIIQLLLDRGCKAILIACNTASAVALNSIRDKWPEIPFVGVEPAIKPAVKQTKTGKIGILATAGTFKSLRYASFLKKHEFEVEIHQNPCIGLVKLIEQKKIDHPETKKLLNTILAPMLEKNVDSFVLGCTHFPFVKHLIKEIVGDSSIIIDPVNAIAKQLLKRLEDGNMINNQQRSGDLQFYATGETSSMEWAIRELFKIEEVEVQNFFKIKRL